jgi:hypothetical protein
MRLTLLACALVAAPCFAQSVPTPPVQPAPPPIIERPVREIPRRGPPPRAARADGALRLSGPRLGMTLLNRETVDRINEVFGEEVFDPESGEVVREEVISPSFPLITQFGWQVEFEMFKSATGLTGVGQFVALAGGLERGIILPSGSMILGVRTVPGFEVGVGPNLSASGVGLALAAGAANNMGDFSVPLNVAVVMGADGARVSMLIGLTFSGSRY